MIQLIFCVLYMMFIWTPLAEKGGIDGGWFWIIGLASYFIGIAVLGAVASTEPRPGGRYHDDYYD